MVRVMRVLIVDDFSTMRRVLRGLLREMGIDAVDEAADGVAALERLRGSEFDFVITDIGMPTMNGFELLAAIKKDERLRHLPVLMVTAEAKKDDIVNATRKGAAGYIVKPFTRAVLEERLRRSAPRLFVSE
ncbi:MAG TPA: response regulator [Caldimonas sp.]|nr:response regulator [Caldimonas sp.]